MNTHITVALLNYILLQLILLLLLLLLAVNAGKLFEYRKLNQ